MAIIMAAAKESDYGCVARCPEEACVVTGFVHTVSNKAVHYVVGFAVSRCIYYLHLTRSMEFKSIQI